MNSYTKEFITKQKRIRIILFVSFFLLLVISILLGLIFGSSYISIKDIFKALGNSSDVNNIIITKIRLPRVIGAIFAGLALAASGVILQSLMQNDLVSPNTIGISSGSGLIVVIFVSLFGNLVSFLPIFAFLGAFLTTLIIYFISYKCGNTKHSIILAGIAITALFQALMKLIFVFDNNSMLQTNDFLIGSLSNIRFNNIIIPIIIITITFIITIIFSNKLNVLALGDEVASSLGVNVKKYRFIFIILSSLLASSVISYAGILGFVGLIIPHISKKLIGNNALINLPFSALLGANLVLICDLLSRLIFSPYEVPSGILISILGVPFFLYLLLRRASYDKN